jgi:hypothetical protein
VGLRGDERLVRSFYLSLGWLDYLPALVTFDICFSFPASLSHEVAFPAIDDSFDPAHGSKGNLVIKRRRPASARLRGNPSATSRAVSVAAGGLFLWLWRTVCVCALPRNLKEARNPALFVWQWQGVELKVSHALVVRPCASDPDGVCLAVAGLAPAFDVHASAHCLSFQGNSRRIRARAERASSTRRISWLASFDSPSKNPLMYFSASACGASGIEPHRLSAQKTTSFKTLSASAIVFWTLHITGSRGAIGELIGPFIDDLPIAMWSPYKVFSALLIVLSLSE